MDEFKNKIPSYTTILKYEVAELNKKIKDCKELRKTKFNKYLFLKRNKLNL
jgi:hypothetical protein